MSTYIVTAAVITDGDRVLITQRKKGSNQELKWEFPGGKLEDGEDPEHCIKREIKEEINIDIEVKKIFKVVMHSYGDRNILLLAYRCSHLAGEPVTLECNSISWVQAERLLDYDLAAADIPIATELQEVMANELKA
ncbi:MAG: (deoxy)nucleoside triphosphate pyrophosphohydrolase [Desulfocucumaceae bacterium]